MRPPRFLIVLVLCLAAVGFGAKRANSAAPAKSKKQSGTTVAAQLRAEWDLGQLQMMRTVIDESTFDPKVKTSLESAIDQFNSQEESLLSQVAASLDKSSSIQQQRAKLLTAFNQKMKVVNDSPAMQKEMATRMKAMDKEIDEVAKSADQLFTHLDAIGVSKQQKDSLRPAVKDASDKVRGTVAKSETRSTKDKKTREQVIKQWQPVHKKIHDSLTPDQRDKLVKKLAGD